MTGAGGQRHLFMALAIARELTNQRSGNSIIGDRRRWHRDSGRLLGHQPGWQISQHQVTVVKARAAAVATVAETPARPAHCLNLQQQHCTQTSTPQFECSRRAAECDTSACRCDVRCSTPSTSSLFSVAASFAFCGSCCALPVSPFSPSHGPSHARPLQPVHCAPLPLLPRPRPALEANGFHDHQHHGGSAAALARGASPFHYLLVPSGSSPSSRSGPGSAEEEAEVVCSLEAPPGVRFYTDGTAADMPLLAQAVAAVTLLVFIGWIYVIGFVMLASLFSKTAALLCLAMWSTILLPVMASKTFILANPVFALWRRYFSFSIIYTQKMCSSQHYLYADFPHGAFPLSQLLGLTVRHRASWDGEHFYGLAADSVFRIPLWRHVYSWLGIVPA